MLASTPRASVRTRARTARWRPVLPGLCSKTILHPSKVTESRAASADLQRRHRPGRAGTDGGNDPIKRLQLPRPGDYRLRVHGHNRDDGDPREAHDP